jgi:predicted ATPase
VEEANLKVNIAALRRALGVTPGGEQLIVTVPGRGYRFVCPVERDVSSPVAGASATISPVRSRVPRILGRSDELEVIAKALTTSRLISVVGPGGIGKTTVAIAAGNAASAAFPDGVGLVDLSTIGSPQFIVVAFASAFGITPRGVDPLACVLQALRNRRMVILIDNCEHLLPHLRPILQRLLKDLECATIITTSREPLGISGEIVVRLDGMRCDTPAKPSAHEAGQYSAIQLFAERSRERSGFVLTDQNAPQVAAICRRLDGNALAIELAATQTTQLNPVQILGSLDDCVRFLRLGPVDAPIRQQSLAATLDWSYRLLSAAEAALLRAVALFGRKFSEGDATALSDMEDHAVRNLLGHLTRKSLIILHCDGAETRFQMLEATRRYCIDRLQLSSEYNALRRRHAEYVCTILERSTVEWAQTPAVNWGAEYSPLLEELSLALDWAGIDENDRPLLIRLTVSGTILWNHFSLHQECRSRTRRALDDVVTTEFFGSQVEMKLLVAYVGSLYTTRGVSDASYQYIQRALDLAMQIGSTADQVSCLHQLYIHNIVAGRLTLAMEQIRTIVAIAPQSDPTTQMAEIAFALLEFWMGQFGTSKERLLKAVKPSRKTINNARRAQFLYEQNTSAQNVLANVQWVTGYPDTAAETARSAIDGGLQLKHDLSLIGVLAVAACKVAFLNGNDEDLDAHLVLFEEALARSGLETWRPWARFYRGTQVCCSSAPDREHGLDIIAGSIVELVEMNHRQRLPFLLAVQSELLLRFGRIDEATRIAWQAAERAEVQQEYWCMPEITRIRSAILAARGEMNLALSLLQDSYGQAQRMGALAWQLRIATDLAAAQASHVPPEEAATLLRDTLGLFTEGFDTRDFVRASAVLAGLNREPRRRHSRPQSVGADIGEGIDRIPKHSFDRYPASAQAVRIGATRSEEPRGLS